MILAVVQQGKYREMYPDSKDYSKSIMTHIIKGAIPEYLELNFYEAELSLTENYYGKYRWVDFIRNWLDRELGYIRDGFPAPSIYIEPAVEEDTQTGLNERSKSKVSYVNGRRVERGGGFQSFGAIIKEVVE
jgi:hypothetical protein